MKVLVTGGTGFLGRHIVRELENRGHSVRAPSHKTCDLRDFEHTHSAMDDLDCVIHAAAHCGGIGFNRAGPADMITANVEMAVNVVRACHDAGVPKLVTIGSVCSYPKHCPTPFIEDDVWNGYPEETNAAYGIAKRTLLSLCQAYRTQHGCDFNHLLLTNLYGPGDNFQPERMHAIPALISKVYRAQQFGELCTLWGTGKATRDFLFVEDAARAIVLAAESYSSPEPVNIGTGFEVSICEVASIIAGTLGYQRPIEWDSAQPDGQPRRVLNVERAKEFGFTASVSIDKGLARTIEWAKQSGAIRALMPSSSGGYEAERGEQLKREEAKRNA